MEDTFGPGQKLDIAGDGKARRLAFAKLVVALGEAERDENQLRAQYRNVRFPTARPVTITHSYVQDGGDAARKGQFEILLTEGEIYVLLEERIKAATREVEALRDKVAAAEASQ